MKSFAFLRLIYFGNLYTQCGLKLMTPRIMSQAPAPPPPHLFSY